MPCPFRESMAKMAVDTIKLIWSESVKDDDGFPTNKETVVEVYAREKSATRTEVYESMRAGVSVQTVFEVRQEDWEETRHTVDGKSEYARMVECDGHKYDVIRTYKTGKAKIEVICG